MRPLSNSTLVFLLAMVVLAASANSANAQAWTQSKGNAYVKLSRGFADADEQFDTDGNSVPYRDGVEEDAFKDRSTYLYLEYGIAKNLTGIFVLPIKSVTVREPGSSMTTSGIGTLMFGTRVGLNKLFGLDNPHRLAFNAFASIPAGFYRNDSPSIGSGEAALQTVVSYGASLYPFPGYLQLGAGYKYRSSVFAFSKELDCSLNDENCSEGSESDFDNEWLLNAELGFSIGKYALIQLLGQGAYSNSAPVEVLDPDNPFGSRQRYSKAGVGLIAYPIEGVGLSVQWFNTVGGRNTIKSTDLFVGLEYKLQ